MTMHHYAEKGLGTMVPAANAVITQTNPFGKSFIKVLDIFGDDFPVTNNYEINFADMSPAQIKLFNERFGDANYMHIDPKTKTAPLYILQKQTATPKDYTNLWELSPTRYSNYDNRTDER